VVIGFQSIILRGVTKCFAINEGLIPEDPRMRPHVPVHHAGDWAGRGSGAGRGRARVSVAALSDWAPGRSAHWIRTECSAWLIPAVTALTLGFQIVLSSFFLSVLGAVPRPVIDAHLEVR